MQVTMGVEAGALARTSHRPYRFQQEMVEDGLNPSSLRPCPPLAVAKGEQWALTVVEIDPKSTIGADLARVMHEPPATTTDLAVLPGVLGPRRTLRRTEQVRLRSEPLRLPGGMPISMISRRRPVHNAGSTQGR